MEYGSNDTSDKDRKMMSSFERAIDDEKDKEKSKDKKKDHTKPGRFFEIAKEDVKPEKEPKPILGKEKKPESGAETGEPSNPEELADDETKLVAEKYVVARGDELQSELRQSEPDSPEEAALLADAAFIEAIADKLPASDVADEALLDGALASTIAELELPNENGPSEPELGDLPIDESPFETDDETEDIPVSSATRASGSIGGTGGAGKTPPPPPPRIPPTPPPGPTASPPPIPTPGGGLPPFGPPSPNAMPFTPNAVPDNPNVLEPPRYQRATDLLVGGVIGYLIGRRRGRIKTEAKLLPVQHKLENEVKDLHEKIAIREQKIRKLAAEKAETEPESIKTLLIEKRAKRHDIQPEINFETSDDKTNMTETVFETRPKQTERLGRIVLPSAEVISDTESGKNIETLALPELLAVAKSMEINGVTAKEMYESGRINAIILRRVVTEFLRGERYQRTLFENLQVADEAVEFKENQHSNMAGRGPGGATPTHASVPQGHSYKPQPLALAAPTALNADLAATKAAAKKTWHGSTSVVAAVAATIVAMVVAFLLLH